MAGIKRSNSLNVNTKGYCFFCINEIGERTKQKRHSLQHLSRYLNITFEKVLKSLNVEASSISLHDSTNANVTVCAKCDKVMTQLSDSFQFFEILQMEMNHFVKSVQSTIAESNVNSDSHWKYWKKMSANVEDTFHLDVANELRMMLLEKCSEEAGKVRPIVVAHKLSKDWNKLISSSSKSQDVDDPGTGRRKNPEWSFGDSDSSDEELFIPVQVKSKSKKRRKVASAAADSVIPEQEKSPHKNPAEILEIENDIDQLVPDNQTQKREENSGAIKENVFQCKTCQKTLDMNSVDKSSKVDNWNDAWQFYFENLDPQPLTENTFIASSNPLLIQTTESPLVEMENQNAINSGSERPLETDLNDTTPDSREKFSSIHQDPQDIQNREKTKKFKCNLCPSTFTQVKGLQRHFRSIHLNEIIPCPNCDKVFKYKHNLKDHIESSHSDTKYFCTVPNCIKHSYGFPSKKLFLKHAKRSHSDITGWKGCFKTVGLSDAYLGEEFETSQFEDFDENLQFNSQMSDDVDNESDENDDEVPFLPSEYVCTLMEI